MTASVQQPGELLTVQMYRDAVAPGTVTGLGVLAPDEEYAIGHDQPPPGSAVISCWWLEH